MTKYFIWILFLGVILTSCSTSRSVSDEKSYTTYIYLVRHAEKADDGTNDPSLTNEGKLRARRLADLLTDKNISQIFSSDYKRTRETAFPTSRNSKIAIRSYDPGNLDEIANNLLGVKGQSILVVGHSNSTPSLANLLVEKEEYMSYDESDYGNIILVTIKDGNKTSSLTRF